jgi:exodeoxyribonuclease V alpha subunit
MIVKAIVEVAEQLASKDRPVRTVLTAPTGKAAKKLGDDVGRPASTLHRALGASSSGSRFQRSAANPLEADLVVVDEASMVDLALMVRLVQAVPRAARLVLLGDEHQLSSVEAGAVLADLCNAPALAPVVARLTGGHRFGASGAIGRLAEAVRTGDTGAAKGVLAEGDAVCWIQPRSRGVLDPRALAPAVERFAAALGAGEMVERLRRVGSFRVLCAHRRGPLGAEDVSEAVARGLAARGVRDRPVLVTRNDYAVGLFNGDVGIESGDRVWFAGRTDGLSRVRLPAHESALATTVHKAQGSQADDVLVVLPDEASPVVVRELLYTAVTRARVGVTIHAPAGVLDTAIATRTERTSGLRDLLA